MADPAIEHTALRYAASLAAVLAIVLLGIGVLFALPESIPFREPAIWAVWLATAAVAIEVMGRIENGESPIRKRLRRLT
ncbi:hypothetical protein ACFQMA_20475 [Halosimplex aquaticum]|uniref:Uncharacterized protein n=1 Tax=Halosimplex aquaticum TaxID=3026162 RepID=A0ABD5Y4D2_9EURY|nr:hypothetical protein [Halosimplex aquaticum]